MIENETTNLVYKLKRRKKNIQLAEEDFPFRHKSEMNSWRESCILFIKICNAETDKEQWKNMWDA